MNTIIAYQFRGGIWLQSDTVCNYWWDKHCRIHFGASVHMMSNVVAKWIIKPKPTN